MEYISITRNTKKDTQYLNFIRLLETSDKEKCSQLPLKRDTVENRSLRAGISGEVRIQKTVGPFHVLRDPEALNCTCNQSKCQSRGEISLSDT